jgi:hypothetical protein
MIFKSSDQPLRKVVLRLLRFGGIGHVFAYPFKGPLWVSSGRSDRFYLNGSIGVVDSTGGCNT